MPKKFDEEKRIARQAALCSAVKEMSGNDPLEAVTDVMTVLIKLLAESFPGDLGDTAKAKIQENYPHATAALMNERAMSPAGVKVALAMCEQLGRIALDYSPDSMFKKDMAQDSGETVGLYGDELNAAYTRALSKGLSVFGASTTMILTGTALGGMNGLGTQRLARPLIDALLLSFNFDTKKPAQEESKEYKAAVDHAVTQVAEQLGISEATARKYAAYVEQQIKDGKL